MKILYFSENYTTHDRLFLLKLAESGHATLFLKLQNDGMRYEKRRLPLSIKQVTLREDFQTVLKHESLVTLMPDLELILNRFKPDIIHAGPVQSCGFMIALANYHPFLIMSWGSDILVDAEKDKMHYWITRYALSCSDMLMCDCDAVKDKVQQIVSYEDRRIVQFPWGIDFSEFRAHETNFNWRTHLGWEDNIIVVSTRSWEKIYGISTVLNAFHQAYKKDSRLRLILVGSGSLEEDIRQYIKINSLKEITFLPGRIAHEQMTDFLNAADLYISASFSDGSSVSLLEAMAIGLPAIVSDIPGNREWIVEGKNGWLVQPDNSEDFSTAILRAANLSKEEMKRISLISKEIVRKRANWNINFRKILEAYDKLYKIDKPI